jgi:plasmid stability protein
MTDILIDNISDEVLENLRIKAELRGQPLEDFARELIAAEGVAYMDELRRIDGSAQEQVSSLAKPKYREGLE